MKQQTESHRMEDQVNRSEEITAKLMASIEAGESEEAEAVQEPVEEATKEPEADIQVKSNFTEKEQLAMSKGWKPKNQFVGDTDDWRTASQFLEYGDIIETVTHLNQKNKKLTEALEKVVASTAQIQQVAFEKARASLQQEMAEATERGDIKRVLELSDKKVAMETNKSVPQQSTDDETKSAVKAFKDKYPCVAAEATIEMSPDDMSTRAYILHREKQLLNKGMSHKDILETIDTEMQAKLKHSTQPSDVKKAQPVSPSGAKKHTSATPTFNDLPEEHKELARNFEKALGKKFNLESYIKNIKQASDRQ